MLSALLDGVILIGIWFGAAVLLRITFPKRRTVTHALTYGLFVLGAASALLTIIDLAVLAGHSAVSDPSPRNSLLSVAVVLVGCLLQKRALIRIVTAIRGVNPFKPRDEQLAANWNLPDLPADNDETHPAKSKSLEGRDPWAANSPTDPSSSTETASEADTAPPSLGDPSESNTVQGNQYTRKGRKTVTSIRESLPSTLEDIRIGNWRISLGEDSEE